MSGSTRQINWRWRCHSPEVFLYFVSVGLQLPVEVIFVEEAFNKWTNLATVICSTLAYTTPLMLDTRAIHMCYVLFRTSLSQWYGQRRKKDYVHYIMSLAIPIILTQPYAILMLHTSLASYLNRKWKNFLSGLCEPRWLFIGASYLNRKWKKLSFG